MNDKGIKITHLISLQHFMKFHINDFGYFELKARYEAFLNRNVEKGMFVPCDENDKPIDKNVADNNYQVVNLYQLAKNCVLFEGWQYDFEDDLLFEELENTTCFLDYEEIKGKSLRELIFDEFKLSQAALNQIYNNYETE